MEQWNKIKYLSQKNVNKNVNNGTLHMEQEQKKALALTLVRELVGTG